MFDTKSISIRYRYDLKKSLKTYNGIEGIDFVECKICKKRSLNIDKRHLKSWHSLTLEEYISMFPDACIVSEKKKLIQTKSATGNTANLGKKFTEEHKRKLAESKMGSKNPFYGKTFSKEVIDKALVTRVNTVLKRYGVTNSVYIDGVKDKIYKKRAYTIDYIKNEIESVEGYKLLSKNYKNIYSMLEIKCDSGHIFKMRYGNFREGQRCPICYRQNNVGANHPNWKNYTNEELEKYTVYRNNVIQLSNHNFRKFYYIINPNKLKRAKYKFHLDHIYSVADGFKNNISPEIISNLNNLQMLWWKDNISKKDKSEITKQLLYHITV